MNNSRTKNTIRNIIYGYISKIVAIILPFVVRTIIIYRIGADYAGLSSLFASILQVLSLTELGFSTAIIYCLYEPIAQNDVKEICEWLTVYRKIYQLIGCIMLGIGVLLTPILPMLIKGGYPSDINIYFLYFAYLTNTVLSYLVFGYKSGVIIVNQRRDILSNVELIVSICRSAIQIAVLMLFKNYYCYVAIIVLSTIISNIVIEIITRKKYPQLRCVKTVNREKIKKVLKPVKGAAIGKFALVSANSFDSIILSATCGLKLVTIYSNYYYIFGSVASMLGILLVSMSAGVGNSIVVETPEKNYVDHNKFDFYYMWIVGWCTVCFCVLYQPFMLLWAGADLVAPYSTMILFCVYFYINNLSQIRGVYSEAAGLWWKFRYIAIIEMVANISLNFVLGYFFQMNGILLATIITVFLASFIGVTSVTFKSLFDRKPTEYYLNNFVYMIVTIFTAVITIFICDIVTSKKNILYTLLLRGIVVIIIPNLIFFAVYYSNLKYKKYIKYFLTNLKHAICGRGK